MCMHACAGTIVHLEGVYTSKFECNYLSGVRPPRPHLNLLARAEPFGKSSTPRSETHPSLFLNSFSFFLLYILLIEERVTVSNDVSLSLSLSFTSLHLLSHMLAPLLHRPCPSSYHIIHGKGSTSCLFGASGAGAGSPVSGAGAAAGGTFASLRVSRGGSARRTVASRRASASGQGASASPSAADAAAGGTRAPGAVTARGGGDGGRGAGGARAPGAAPRRSR